MTNKLSANMANVLIGVADKGYVTLRGRDKISARALVARGLLKVSNTADVKGLIAEVTDAGYALAVELV